MRFRWALVLSLLVLIAPSGRVAAQESPQSGESDPEAGARAEASAHFRRGVALFAEGDFEAALVEFERAHEARPTFHVLYNIAQSQLALRNYGEAHYTLRRYLEQGGDEVSAERRTEVDGLLAELNTRIAELALMVDVDGAGIYVDGELQAETPADPLVLDVGEHTITIRKEGYRDHEEFVTIIGGENQAIGITLEPIPVTAAPRVAESHPAQAIGIAGFVLTGLTAGAAIVTGVLAYDANNALDAALATIPSTLDNVGAAESARADMRTFSTATDALIGLAAGFAVVSTILLLIDSGDSATTDAPDRGEPERDDAEVEDEEAPPSLSLHFGPLSVGGQF